MDRPRTAVVTGCGSGIGLAISTRLAADGWTIIGIERDGAHADRFAAELPGSADLVIRGDVVDAATLEAAARLAEEVGVLTGWVNNAAVNRRGNLHAPSIEEVRETFEVNLAAPFWGASVAIRSFLRFGIPGRILNISSIHATHAFPDFAAYDVAKGGVNALTRYIAVEYGAVGIRANAIAPAAIRTDMVRELISDERRPERTEETYARLHPLGRIGDPHEVAAVAAFLLGEESSFVTGQVIGVDGGASARAYPFESSLSGAQGPGAES